MIIKKPYAFIIKHFRMIHLVLLIPMIYLVIQTKQIISFFSEYSANNYVFTSTISLNSLAGNYIHFLMFLAIIIILIIYIILSILLQKKDKPTKYYNIAIVYYIVIFILLVASLSIFKAIEEDTLDVVFARIIRDLALIIHYSQYIFIIFNAIRGIGFNIKKFNFKSDLEELEISSEDSEEVEFIVGIDSYKTKRSIRRFFRELKYYYKENKFIFTIIIVIFIIIVGSLIYTQKEIYQRTYNENESIAFGYLNVTILDSYITNLTKDGKVLNSDKYYVVLQLEVANRYREDKELNYTNIELVVNNKYFTPNISVGNYFVDYGVPYNGTLIKGNTSSKYILVYEIDKYLMSQKFHVEIYSHYDSSADNNGLINTKVNISPEIIKEEITTKEVNKATIINLDETNLKSSTISINNYVITDRYEYPYQYCSNDTCTQKTGVISTNYTDGSNTTILALDYSLNLDTSSSYMTGNRTYRSFFEDFAKIKYVIDNQSYTTNVKIANPQNYNTTAIMRVPKAIKNADNIYVIITIRNKSYQIKML